MNDASAPDGVEWHPPWTVEEGAERASRLFVDSFGTDPRGVWSAPGRVNIIGEHTDYNGGLSLPTVLRHRAYVAAARRDDRVLRIASGDAEALGHQSTVWELPMEQISPASAAGWPAYAAGVVWALLERGYDGPGLDMAVTSCVPLGAGLSSSAAFSCASARAVSDLWRLALEGEAGAIELAEVARDAENQIAGAPTGRLDQYAALLCRENEGIEIDFAASPPAVRRTPLYFPEYGLVLLVIDTRHPRSLTDGRYRERFDECRAAAAQLGAASLREVADGPDPLGRVDSLDDDVLRRRARHVVTEIERVRIVADELAGTGPAHERFVEVGRRIYRSHTSLATDFEVSSPELDLAVNAAWTAGALGARLVGAGFGGAVIALVRKTQLDVTARIVDRAFADAGMAKPRFLYA